MRKHIRRNPRRRISAAVLQHFSVLSAAKLFEQTAERFDRIRSLTGNGDKTVSRVRTSRSASPQTLCTARFGKRYRIGRVTAAMPQTVCRLPCQEPHKTKTHAPLRKNDTASYSTEKRRDLIRGRSDPAFFVWLMLFFGSIFGTLYNQSIQKLFIATNIVKT